MVTYKLIMEAETLMDGYEKALEVMNELFGKDCVFSLSDRTERQAIGSICRHILSGWIILCSYACKTQKSKISRAAVMAALTNQFHRFTGKGRNIGHPLRPENQRIREDIDHRV